VNIYLFEYLKIFRATKIIKIIITEVIIIDIYIDILKTLK